jgi:hypothetical protein
LWLTKYPANGAASPIRANKLKIILMRLSLNNTNKLVFHSWYRMANFTAIIYGELRHVAYKQLTNNQILVWSCVKNI